MSYKDEVLAYLHQKDAHESEFLQAVDEALDAIEPVLERKPHYRKTCCWNGW